MMKRASHYGPQVGSRRRPKSVKPNMAGRSRRDGWQEIPELTAETPEDRLAEFRTLMRAKGLAMTRDDRRGA